MKKKLLGTGLALAIALTCTAPLAACDLFGGGDGNNGGGSKVFAVTASSIEVKEVSLNATLSGWGLTDTQTSGERTLHCVDLYVYAESSAPGFVEIRTEDFTATNGKPVSIHAVDEAYSVSGLELTSTENRYKVYANVQEYLNGQKPYLSKRSEKEEKLNRGGYTVTTGTSYYQFTAADLAPGRFQRYALEFEEENLSSAIQYKGQNIFGVGNSEMFPSNSYKFGSSNLQMFIDDNHSYEVTYGATTQTYDTAVEEELTHTECLVEIKGISATQYTSATFDDFSLVVGENKYTPSGHYSKIVNNSELQDTRFLLDIDKYKDMDFRYIKCEGQKIETDYYKRNVSLDTDAIDCTFYFPELRKAPTSFKLYYKDTEITIK